MVIGLVIRRPRHIDATQVIDNRIVKLACGRHFQLSLGDGKIVGIVLGPQLGFGERVRVAPFGFSMLSHTHTSEHTLNVPHTMGKVCQLGRKS
jgi:hypothetical protein